MTLLASIVNKTNWALRLERRAVVRHPCRLAITYRLAFLHTKRACEATVRDISTHGFGMIAEERLEPDKVLWVTLPTLATPRLARIRYVLRRESGWLIGCSLVHMFGGKEIQNFLRRPWDAVEA